MKEIPNYYSILTAEVRYDKNLKDKAKLLYSEITALSDKYGYCYASNKYFAELYGVSVTTISLLIKDLVENGYIESEIIYKDGTKEILNRYLKIVKGGYLRNLKEGYLRKVKDNNINNNNTSINNNKRFIKPTLEEVKEYCSERKNNVDPEAFIDFYESKGWKIGNNQMKDWKASIRTWEKRNKKENKKIPSWIDKDIEADIMTPEEYEKFMKELEEIK